MDSHYSSNQESMWGGSDKSACQTMALIRNIEKRKKYLFSLEVIFLIWLVLFIPLLCHYLIYSGNSNFGFKTLRLVAGKAELAEMKIFNEDFILNNNHSIIFYIRSLDTDFYQLHNRYGVNQAGLLWVSLVGLIGVIFSSRMFKFYKVSAN